VSVVEKLFSLNDHLVATKTVKQERRVFLMQNISRFIGWLQSAGGAA
jgi:hypothetical protein